MAEESPATHHATFTQREVEGSQPDDFFSFEYRDREIRCFRRLIGDVRSGTYYVKFRANGKQVFRGTGETKKTKAMEVAKLIVAAALDSRWDALRESKLRKEKTSSTIEEILEAYEKRYATFNVSLKERTANGYLGALKSILRKVHEVDDVGSLPASVLSEQLVEKYFSTHVRGAGDDLLERDKRIRGANSTLTNARALFGRDAMKCYRGLLLPDLKGFLEATTADNPTLEHAQISEETIWEISQAALWLRERCPSLYLVHLLYRHLGMRNDEISQARLEWIERRTEEVWLPNGEKRVIAGFMVIKRRSYWVPKRSTGQVPIAPDVLAEIDKLATDLKKDDFLVTARTKTDREDLVDRDHNDFLRPWVKDHSKVSYELRRWAATVVARRQGEEFAERFLRHKSQTTAGKHYITQQASPAPITFADCGL